MFLFYVDLWEYGEWNMWTVQIISDFTQLSLNSQDGYLMNTAARNPT